MKRSILVLTLVALIISLIGCVSSQRSISDFLLSLKNDDKIEIHLEERIRLPKVIDGQNWNMQGGDSDGKYGYFVFNDGGDVGQSVSHIYKIDLDTWETVKISDDLFLGHANDVTYIPEKHQLIISWCENPADMASVVDADTLEVLSDMKMPQNHSIMDYCVERRMYTMTGWTKNPTINIYSNDFTLKNEIPVEYSFAHQGLECDNKLIYLLQSPLSAGKQCFYITVFDWDGQMLRLIEHPLPYEAENLSIVGDKMILSVNDHHEEKTIRIYELTMTKEK